MASNSSARRSGSVTTAGSARHEVAMAVLLRSRVGAVDSALTEPGQALISFFSFSVCEIEILRGFACGATGIRSVRTPAS